MLTPIRRMLKIASCLLKRRRKREKQVADFGAFVVN